MWRRSEVAGSPSAALKDAGLAGFVALMLAVPLVGFRTIEVGSGLTLQTRFDWVAYGVIAVFVGRLILNFWPQAWKIQRRKEAPHVSNAQHQTTIKLVALGGIGFAVALPFLPFADRYVVDLAITVLIYVMLGWGLNIVVGLAGLLDLGYVAFYAVGAYSFALGARYWGLDFWEALPLAGALAAMLGMLLGFPVLRLRGDYLAIVTLGFGEMIRLLIINLQSFTGGPNGVSGIPRPSFFGFPFAREAETGGPIPFHELFGLEYSTQHRFIFLYFIILVLALITNAFTMRIRRLPIGRAWEALREDEIACKALGINPTNTKLTAFAIGAMFGGFAGAFFATRQGFISPESFNFLESAFILAIVVLGGMGSQTGIVIAALLLVVLPEVGREFAEFRMLLFGAAMIAIMVWRPYGLLSRRAPTITLGSGA
jgi:branched-chain amino acid transport system permease protein